MTSQQLHRQAAHVESSPPPAWRCSSGCGCRCQGHQQLHRQESSAYGEKQSYSGGAQQRQSSSAYGEQQYYGGGAHLQESSGSGSAQHVEVISSCLDKKLVVGEQQSYNGDAQQLHRSQALHVQSGEKQKVVGVLHRQESSGSAYGEKQYYSGGAQQLQSSAYEEQQYYNGGAQQQLQSSAYGEQQYYNGGAQELRRSQATVQSGERVQITPPPQLGKAAQATSYVNSVLAQKLHTIIEANGLQSFYNEARLQATLQKVSSINFAQVADQWKISKEVAYNLAPLALYNIVFFCDDSGSMTFEEDGTRVDDLKFILSKVSEIASKFHDEGITVRFMNSNVKGDRIRNATEVGNLISKVRFSGLTPLGTNLDRKVIQPFVLAQATSANMAKPVLAIVITDGEPVGEARGTICQVIHRAKDALAHTRYGGGAFALQIAQVGKDAKAQKFLESLDNDPVLGGMIDCTSYYEMEEEEFERNGGTLTPELWLLKMCVGAIDPEYDAMDT